MADLVVPSDARIIFLDARRFENGAATRGAALVTDTDTKPLEFRCTNAVRPTSLQKALYGGILDQHLLVDLICVPLVNAISHKASLIVVREPMLLELRAKIATPVVSVMSQEETASVGEKTHLDKALLQSEAGKFEPVVVAVSENFKDDVTIARTILQVLGKRCSPLEPFERMQLALQQVHEQRKD
jgi:hypothetical protein